MATFGDYLVACLPVACSKGEEVKGGFWGS